MSTILTRNDSPHFTGCRWAAKAVSVSDVRFYLNYLYVPQDGRVIGCDDHRIHAYKPSSECLEPGYYRVIKATTAKLEIEKADVDAKYPDIDKFFRDFPEAAGDWIELSSNESSAIYKVSKILDKCLNFHYLIDALSMIESTRLDRKHYELPVHFECAVGTSNATKHGIVFRSAGNDSLFSGIVMGMRP